MNARSYIYSLKTVKDTPVLCIDLGLNIEFEDTKLLEIKIGDELVTLNKFEFMNKPKVVDKGGSFFIVASKAMAREWAFDILMKYAINKLDTRISYLETLKNQYKKILTENKQLIAA